MPELSQIHICEAGSQVDTLISDKSFFEGLRAHMSQSECDLLGGWLKVLYILKYASNHARTYGHPQTKRYEL